MRASATAAGMTFGGFRCQGTLFALTEDEFDHLAALLIERNPDVRRHLEGSVAGVGPLTRLTFHASYSYEDFIEGFRPVVAKGGNLALRLEDGIFKRVCREAGLGGVHSSNEGGNPSAGV
jgi:5-methylcytosine-specific restriction protein B